MIRLEISWLFFLFGAIILQKVVQTEDAHKFYDDAVGILRKALFPEVVKNMLISEESVEVAV